MNVARVLLPPPAAARETQIDLIFFDAGGGHRASATALKALADQQQRGWQIRMVNLRDILEPIDVFHRLTGVRVEDLYNRMLKYGLTIGTGPMLRAVQFLIRRMHPRNVALLARYWQERRPDLVVSLIPNFNRAIFEGLRIADRERSRPATPMVTILTDLADCPPHFWIERQEQYLICGTAKAAAAGAGDGLSARARAPHVGDDRAARVLSPTGYQPRTGAPPARTASRSADRPGDVRRIRLAPHADDRAARGRGRGEDPADLFVRPQSAAARAAFGDEAAVSVPRRGLHARHPPAYAIE